MAAWTLSPGGAIKRTQLHRLFGGNGQSGISPSKQSPNVFFFSDPASGEQHGYFDDWKTDGCFHYTGEGKYGDQELTKGNLAIAEAAQKACTLRGFEGVGGKITYLGRFELDADEPSYTRDAPETGGGRLRTVIVFRLRPLDIKPGRARGLQPVFRHRIRTVPVEERNTERMIVEPTRQPYEAERRESALVQRFKAAMEKRGHRARRLEIVPAGETNCLFNDLYFPDIRLLVEAKGGVDRNSIRMGIGQLMDYRRFINPKPRRCAILLPRRPREDLVELLGYAGLALYYPNGEAFDVVVPSKTSSRDRAERRSVDKRDTQLAD